MKTTATVTDVARLAGVSVATVSRAFTSPDVVSADTRGRVVKAAERLGFSPNPAPAPSGGSARCWSAR